MLQYTTIPLVKKNQLIKCTNCTIQATEAGARIQGNNNTFLSCTGFSGSGDNAKFNNCSNVVWSGNYCTIFQTSHHITLTGNYTTVVGHDCLIMGLETRNEGRNNTLERPMAERTIQARRAERERQATGGLPSGRPGRVIHGTQIFDGSMVGPEVIVQDRNGNRVTYPSYDHLPEVVEGNVRVGMRALSEAYRVMGVVDTEYIDSSDSDSGSDEIPTLPLPDAQRRIEEAMRGVGITTNGRNSPAIHIGTVHVRSSSSAPAPAPTPPPITYPDAPLGPEPTTQDEAKQCIICCDRVKVCVMVPCGHQYACVTCIRKEKTKQCAFCRKPITCVVRLFDASNGSSNNSTSS